MDIKKDNVILIQNDSKTDRYLQHVAADYL